MPRPGDGAGNDEVKDGVSERGGYPVERKKMTQWMMRITAYAERLLQGLNDIDWSEALKEMQRNWIGKSLGATVRFGITPRGESLPNSTDFLAVFTTRVDTIFGVTYLAIAPEHELIPQLTTPDQQAAVAEYVTMARNRSERDRMSDVKTVSGVFTGSYVTNPLTDERVPVWIADYVLAGYGTGVVMGVPSSDDRDYRFAQHFGLPIVCVIEGTEGLDNPCEIKYGKLVNSGFLNGLDWQEAIRKAIARAEELGVGTGKTNYRLRDAVFSRQRYWGEPVPVYFKDKVPYPVDESKLPLVLPEIDKYLPTETGEPPLGRAEGWKYHPTPPSPASGEGLKEKSFSDAGESSKEKSSPEAGEDSGGVYDYELSTMPGWAGSSWYWYRYMDADNDQEFAAREAIDYWRDVDLYIGGSEHATGHLLYSRFWNHFLYDLGLVVEKEPFKKLINQGMIQGVSEKIFKVGASETPEDESEKNAVYYVDSANAIPRKMHILEDVGEVFVSAEVVEKGYPSKVAERHVDVSLVRDSELDIARFTEYRSDYTQAAFVCEGGYWKSGIFTPFGNGGSDKFRTKAEIEKMSKSKFNVVNPDDVIERYGADTLRLYEMFLGPLEQSKPWNTNGIDGSFKFLRKLWRLFYDEQGHWLVTDEAPPAEGLKTLHRTIRKVEEDVERYAFNTTVSTFMICVNELGALKCHQRTILQDLVIILSPYAPHVAEELWHQLGNPASVTFAAYPPFRAEYLTEESFEYPISINGKVRAKITFSLDTTPAEIEKSVLASEGVQKWLEGKSPKKVIIVPKKIVNVVV
ncbi:MAG: leucine--tRNA ligase [Ferruginibacter sp.]|nr:leucine--tRNA ligase [Cytophagales bacterium]